MADYNINAITRRRVFTGSAGVGPYAFTFEILDQGDLAVYFNETKLTITTDYTVTINANGTGSVTLVVNVGGNVPQTPVGSDQIIVVGARDIERVTDFVTAGDLLASSLNEQLDALTIFDQQLAEEGQRSMRAPVYDPALVADGGTLDMTLPAKADRVDAVLAFDTDGNPIKGPTVSGITTMTALAADITALADIEDGTVATDAISNTATVVSDIPTVAGVASDVSTVAGISSDVTTVANNVSDVTAFAQIYRVGSTDPTSNNDVGDLFYNTTSDTLKIWQGSAWVIAASEISGYLPVTGGTITGDLTLSGGGGHDILFDQSRKILHFKNTTKAAFGSIPSSSANPNTADIEIYRNNAEGAVIGFADTSGVGTKIASFIKNTTADVNYIQFTPTQDVALFYNGVEKFATENTGVGVIGDINVSGLVDGRDVAADGTKLDGIEASADVTDAGNVNPLVDAHLNQSTAANGEVLSWNGSDYDWVAQTVAGGGDLLAANNLSDLDNVATARTNLGLGTAATTAFTDYATAAQGTTADAALPRTGGAMTGAITTNSTFDGRDVATDGAKLDGIAAGANNYVHPNHTGEVTSTADGATVIADNVVDEANLKVSNAPTNGYALTAQSGAAGGLTWAAVGGGGASLELYAENPSTPTNPTAGGNNSVAIGNNATVTTAGSGLTGDKSIAIGHNSSVTSAQAVGIGRQATISGQYASGFGYKATSAGTQSHAATNSYASGTNSFAAAIANNTSSYGATGNNSIAIGQLAKATSARGVAIGANAQSSATSIALNTGWNSMVTSASGSNSVAIGGNTSATSAGSFSFGQQSSSAIRGKYAYAAGSFAAQGDAQGGQFILRADTTDATATALTTNNATAAADNQIVAASDTCITFDGTITAMQNGAQAYASWRIEGLLVNDGGTTTVANSAITVIQNTSNWGLTLTADNTNNALAITFTGEAAHNIRTVANIRTTEVTYA